MRLRELTAAMCHECVKKNVNWEGEVVVYSDGRFYPISKAIPKLKDNVLLLQINPNEYTNEISPPP